MEPSTSEVAMVQKLGPEASKKLPREQLLTDIHHN